MPRWSIALLALLLALPAFAQKKEPADALAALKPGDGLKVELFAAEPMVLNPTSIDVDHKGRVWVAEAVNYRRKMFGRPMIRKEGDRIQVLIDEKGEGKATKAVTFYQGEELYGPLSVLVIPTNGGKSLRVLVAQSPDILEFTCKDADNPVADGKPKKFLTGFGGFDHDHGVHGLHLGPDGKLYFTVGDSGVKDLQSSDGKGKKWTSNGTDVQKGTVWRCDLDGKNLELIAHNFRNNYEACVDSFGEIWLSDNDDDGNEQTRICFVFPGGNYGYGPRGPGQSHWHEEQPGIVHKTLRTGFGSPTGIQFYEGSLLPKQYHNTLMHCDAGPREVRAFTRKPKGAGYELDKALMLSSTDTWFRPSDVCTAPDGSVFVADWYDKGVGGHGMNDPQDGRIYRLTPKDHKGYKVPEVKLAMDAKLFELMESPNLTTRYLASTYAIEKGDLDAFEKVVTGMRKEGTRKGFPPLLVRSLLKVQWDKVKDQYEKSPLLQSFAQQGAEPAQVAMGVRVERWFLNRSVLSMVAAVPAKAEKEKIYDTVVESLGVVGCRELLCDARLLPAEEVTPFFSRAAKLYDGKDIFYRAALNIACGTDPERRDKILAGFDTAFPEWNDKTADLVWELRPKSMLPKLEKLVADAKLTAAQKARIVDIIAVYDDPAAGKTALALLKSDVAEVRAKAVDNLKRHLPGKWKGLTDGDTLKTAVAGLLADEKTAATGLQLVSAAAYLPSLDDVVKLALDKTTPAPTRLEAVRTLGKIRDVKAVEALMAVGTPETELSVPCVVALGEQLPKGDKGSVAETKALEALQRAVTTKPEKATLALRSAAVAALIGSKAGTVWLLALKEKNEFPADLTTDAGKLLRNSPFQDQKNKAALLFPPPGKLDPKKLPSVTELAKKKGNADNGKAVLAKSLTGEAQCLKCHTVRGTGGSIGPDLSMIGKKGGKDSLYDSLLSPSKAIADQYVSWRIDSDDGQSVTGLLVEETPTKITLRDANGKDYTFNPKEVKKAKSDKSIMPEDVIKAFTEDELIDVVEYLSTLQTPSLTPDAWLIAGPFEAKDDKALDTDFGPEKAFDPAAKFKSGNKEITWRTVRSDSKGYFDLAAFHGADAPNSLSYLYRVIESPADQEVTILLGTDDGCRLVVNGEKVFGHENHFAATPAKDSVKVKLKKGANTVLLKINNGSIPHGFYLTIEGGTDLKVGK